MSVFSDNQKQQTIYWLLHNQATVKTLLKPLEAQKQEFLKSEAVEFHEDIQKDFLESAKLIIESEIGRQLALPVDSIKEVLEALNLEEYLKV